MKTQPNCQRTRKLTSPLQQNKQKLNQPQEPEFLSAEEEELYRLLDQDQEWLEQKIARLQALPSYKNLSREQAEEMAVYMFRFAALLYELVTSDSDGNQTAYLE